MHEGSKRAIIAAFVANLGIALSKLVAFVFTGSTSMLAEAIHSFADTGNQGLLMLGAKRTQKPPDDAHPFGYARMQYFWAFVVALVLFTLGGLFAIFEGIEKIRDPHELDSPVWAIAVLLFAVVLEGFSFRTAVREAEPLRRGRSLLRFVRETKNAELPIVLLEDTGALFGLLFALAGVVLASATGDARYDAMGTLAIGVLLVVIAGLLAVEMASLLIGESADPAEVSAIEAAMLADPGVRRIIHLRTVHIGPDDIMVATKLEFDHTLDVEHLAANIDAVEVCIREAVPAARLVFIEPDVYRAGEPATGGNDG